jgi:hypothetical protein
LCAAKSAEGGDLSRNRFGLATTEWTAIFNVAVIAKWLGFERRRDKTTLIDKAWTPSYVLMAARSCSMLAIPLQMPEKCRISPWMAASAACHRQGTEPQ